MVRHCPCEACEYSADGGLVCAQNVENECREGGGYESFRPRKLAMMDEENVERYVENLEHSNEMLMDCVMERNREICELQKQLKQVKPGEVDKIMQWSVTVLAWACWGLLIWRIIEWLI